MVPVVIIPVLNRYDLLERCIDSLDFPVDKIIIIDNGGKIEEDCWLCHATVGTAKPTSWTCQAISVLRHLGILVSR